MKPQDPTTVDMTQLSPQQIEQRLQRLAELERVVAERSQELCWTNERLVAELYERDAITASAEQAQNYDAATGLPNRAHFEALVQRAASSHFETGEPAAVLVLGVARLSAVRETLGFEAADQAARTIGERLRHAVRGSDLVARIGDDEFALMLVHLRASQDAASVARKLVEAIEAPLRAGGRELRLETAIGVSLFPEDGTRPAALLSRAQSAMRHACEHGARLYQFFNAAIGEESARRLRLDSELRRALEQREFVVHYQPRFNLRSRRLVGAEALLRWLHPQRGLLSAAHFIDVAHDNGLINPIGEAALRLACADARLWPRPISVAINLSTREFRGAQFEAIVDGALRDTGLDPRRLMIDINETSLGRHADEIAQAADRLSALRSRGVRVALDDFGTGACSLTLLRQCEVDCLKIDGSLVRSLGDEPGAAALVRTIASLGRHFGARVIAKGIESEAQLERARRAGCAEAQGYLLGRPMPAAELAELLRPSRAAAARDTLH